MANRYFIATELVFKLEDFTEACAAATQDEGRTRAATYVVQPQGRA